MCIWFLLVSYSVPTLKKYEQNFIFGVSQIRVCFLNIIEVSVLGLPNWERWKEGTLGCDTALFEMLQLVHHSNKRRATTKKYE